MNTTDIKVSGMTCEHCVASVTEELSEVPGVAGVNVDLVSGGESAVHITHDGDLDAAQVNGAVEEAGYSVVG